jgi:YcaO cyclodehydratase, ATP-ad Mg2+-binding
MLKTLQRSSTAERRLAALSSIYPLPRGCALKDRLLDRVQVGGLELSMVGLVASAPGRASVMGSAAGIDGYPVDRAYFELLERTSLIRARARRFLWIRTAAGDPQRRLASTDVFPPDANAAELRNSLSSGVAMHVRWQSACDAALCELIERDRVLRSFAGEFPPRAVRVRDNALVRALRGLYRVEAYRFDPIAPGLTHTAVGLFLFPHKPALPLAYGFAAAREREGALRSATREAVQRLAFLWGEALPERPPAPSPTPDYHQEFWLYPSHQRALRAWLAGRTRARKRAIVPILDGDNVTFADLTPRGLPAHVRVVRAISARALPLRFGRSRRHPRSCEAWAINTHSCADAGTKLTWVVYGALYSRSDIA